jgi:hypothetical protein
MHKGASTLSFTLLTRLDPSGTRRVVYFSVLAYMVSFFLAMSSNYSTTRKQHPNLAVEILYRSIYGARGNRRSNRSSFTSILSYILNRRPRLLSRPVLSSKHVGAITALDVDNGNEESRYMLSGSWDSTVSIWSSNSKQVTQYFQCRNRRGVVLSQA